jgi:hypothetical protein
MKWNKQSSLNDILDHGWVDYNAFNGFMSKLGFKVKQLGRHNMTDGEIHFRYTHELQGKVYDLNANYWDSKSFTDVVKWLDKNGFINN